MNHCKYLEIKQCLPAQSCPVQSYQTSRLSHHKYCSVQTPKRHLSILLMKLMYNMTCCSSCCSSSDYKITTSGCPNSPGVKNGNSR